MIGKGLLSQFAFIAFLSFACLIPAVGDAAPQSYSCRIVDALKSDRNESLYDQIDFGVFADTDGTIHSEYIDLLSHTSTYRRLVKVATFYQEVPPQQQFNFSENYMRLNITSNFFSLHSETVDIITSMSPPDSEAPTRFKPIQPIIRVSLNPSHAIMEPTYFAMGRYVTGSQEKTHYPLCCPTGFLLATDQKSGPTCFKKTY